MKINLQELADAVAVSETHTGYIDLEQGKVILSSAMLNSESNCDNMDLEEEEQMDQSIKWEHDWQRYIALPNLGDYDFWELFHQFLESDKVNEDQRVRLEDAYTKRVHGPVYMKMLREMHLVAEWEVHLNEYFIRVAQDWCEENNVDYE